jgi:uncharacterized RDD family membrane protein YckC
VRRLAAYFVDCALLLAGLLIVQALLYAVNPVVAAMRTGRQPTPALLHAWVFATATVPFLVYFAWRVRSPLRATLGMRLLGLEVASVDGRPIGWGKALLRSAVLLVPFELNHLLMFHLSPRGGPPSLAFRVVLAAVWVTILAYLVTALATPRGQSVHDLVAGTVVRRT